MIPTAVSTLAMELDEELTSTIDLQAQELILAASNHDVNKLRDLLRQGYATVQDPETGTTPLHAAIASCEHIEEEQPNGNHVTNGDEPTNSPINGHSPTPDATEKTDIEAAVETVQLLFRNGAIWNDLDNNNETPGCLAHRLGLKELYDLMVDAGVRAELLLMRLD